MIITGGTGLLGRALCAELAREGAEVVVLSRNPARAPAMPSGVELRAWDGRTTAWWGHLVDGADAVVNLAGASIAEGRWTVERKRLLRESRVNAGRAVAQAVEAAQTRPRVVVQASAVGYYGPRGDEPVDEETPPGRDFLASLCVDWEASTRPVEALGVRRVVIRTGIVLSREGGALPRLARPVRWFVGGPLGSGRQWVPWIHLADHVAATRFLIGHEAAHGPFNLCAPNPVTNEQFMRALGRALRRPVVLRVPAFALRLLLGELAESLLSGQRQVPRRLEALGFRFRFPELQEALRDLLR